VDGHIVSRIGVAILGSTGSVGVSTLDVLSRHPERFQVVALAARNNVAALAQQCRVHRPHYAALLDTSAAERLGSLLKAEQLPTRVISGPDAITDIAILSEVAYVMAAIVGAAGLRPTLAAARAGKRVLLANKEALVMSGPLFLDAVRQGRAELIPIDSEHNAIFQCLPSGTAAGERPQGIRKVVLTASGGPFLRLATSAMAEVTPEQACAHPRWAMGRKISVDSATLMNKGLELIEASLLFDMPPANIDVVVHPQSIVHSMVEYLDGSVLAQLGNPDMRTPIAHALGCPDRLASGVEFLDLTTVGKLEFEKPDTDRFPCLGLARAAATAGGTVPAVLNAANEVAVNAFLDRRLGFGDIAPLIERTLESHRGGPAAQLDDVIAADSWARAHATAALSKTGRVANND
jgi:1-deoxy-D-xylulose-5-phosphate reductoisomerase